MISAWLAAGALAQSLDVHVHGVVGQGTVGCALFVTDNGFPENDRKAHAAVQVDAATAESGVVVCRFPDIEARQVAVTVMHDRDDDGKLDTNWLGLPKEPYGFSNNVGLGTFGPPSFEATLVARAPRIRIDLVD